MTKSTKTAATAPVQPAPDVEVKKAAAPAITLRDEIAMRAPPMPAWWTNGYMARTGHNIIDAVALATWAYEYADAAMKAREA